jgi:glycosyltransferase involved in cell wall biosynthesis
VTRCCMIVANSFTHDSRVQKEADTLIDRGWRVTVVATAQPGLPRIAHDSRLRVIRVPRDPLLVTVIKQLLAHRGLGLRATGDARPVSFPPSRDVGGPELAARRVLEALAHARFWRRAAIAAARSRPDLVVAHDLDALPAGWAAARWRKAPLVYDSHELWLEMPPQLPRSERARRRWGRAERVLARSADRVVTVNDSIANELQRRYGIDPPLVVRNVPVRMTEASAPGDGLRARLGTDRDTAIVLYVGGIQPGRGLEQLVQAVRKLAGVMLVLVGPGEAAYVGSLVAAGIPGWVRALPPVPSQEVGILAAEADVGVVPYRNLSLNHYLSLPTKLFEYLAAGLPVVCGDFPELRRIVLGCRVGCTCDTDDPEAVAAAIQQVLAQRDEMRARAARAGEQLTWEGEGVRYAEALERLVSSR